MKQRSDCVMLLTMSRVSAAHAAGVMLISSGRWGRAVSRFTVSELSRKMSLK